MRAVNLIPADEQRGAGGRAGRSGGTVYVVLGALAAFVVLAGMWAMAGSQADSRRAELADVRVQAEAAQAKADSLAAYARFATVAESRLQTVSQLASSRFDWSHTLREVGRVVPRDIALSSLDGTAAAPTATPAAGASAAAPAAAGPTLKLTGCTPARHQSVARFMARLRQVDGVQRVALEGSTKDDASSASAGTGAGCSSDKGTGAPTFRINVTFGAVPVDPTVVEGAAAPSPTPVNAAGGTP